MIIKSKYNSTLASGDTKMANLFKELENFLLRKLTKFLRGLHFYWGFVKKKPWLKSVHYLFACLSHASFSEMKRNYGKMLGLWTHMPAFSTNITIWGIRSWLVFLNKGWLTLRNHFQKLPSENLKNHVGASIWYLGFKILPILVSAY